MRGDIGDNQRAVLHSLHERGAWPGGGWTWGTPRSTERIMLSLEQRGLVDVEQIETLPYPNAPKAKVTAKYTINETGKAMIADDLAEREARRAAQAAERAKADAEVEARREREAETRRACDEALVKIKEMFAELPGCHPDMVVVARDNGRIGILVPAEAMLRVTTEAFDRYEEDPCA